MVSTLLEGCVAAIQRALALVFIAAIALNFVNVVARYGFGSTIIFADEIEIMILILITFVGAGVVSWRQAHLRMDVVIEACPAWLQGWARLLEFVTSVLLFGFVVYQSFAYVGLMHSIGRRSDVADLPMWIPHAAVTVGFGLMLAMLTWRACAAVSRYVGKRRSASIRGEVVQ